MNYWRVRYQAWGFHQYQIFDTVYEAWAYYWRRKGYDDSVQKPEPITVFDLIKDQ